MLLVGGLVTLGFLAVLLLAVYAKTTTDEVARLRALLRAAGQLADCILDPTKVDDYQKDPTLLPADKIALVAALKDPDGKAAAVLLGEDDEDD